MNEKNQPASGFNCYSSGERGAMAWTQDVRARALGPLLLLLRRLGVTANHLTLASLAVGVAFAPLLLCGYPSHALAALGLHLLLDGLDGPLARLAKTASGRGSFSDATSDQIVVAVVTVTLMKAQVIGPLVGGLHLFLYTLVVVFATVRSAMGIPYSWVVRPRLLIYAWLVVELYFWPGTLVVLLWACNALLSVKLLTGFLKIRQQL